MEIKLLKFFLFSIFCCNSILAMKKNPRLEFKISDNFNYIADNVKKIAGEAFDYEYRKFLKEAQKNKGLNPETLPETIEYDESNEAYGKAAKEAEFFIKKVIKENLDPKNMVLKDKNNKDIETLFNYLVVPNPDEQTSQNGLEILNRIKSTYQESDTEKEKKKEQKQLERKKIEEKLNPKKGFGESKKFDPRALEEEQLLKQKEKKEVDPLHKQQLIKNIAIGTSIITVAAAVIGASIYFYRKYKTNKSKDQQKAIDASTTFNNEKQIVLVK